MVHKVVDLSEEELARIRSLVGEAFVGNALFANWGSEEERRFSVLLYMSLYVDFVYEAGCLYSNDSGTGFIGLQPSFGSRKWPQVKMLFRMVRRLGVSRLRPLLSFVREISGSNSAYASQPHIDCLMVCVIPACQGAGIARSLVEFAMDMASSSRVPLLFDTDMPEYASMYQHLGCRLYNSVTASNGVTRYSLVWEKQG